jgi:Family of unknown function (DUF6455)
MIGYVEAPRAWWLTHGMARAAGLDLPRAVLDGWISRKELAALVSRCQTCARETTCTSFLAEVPRSQDLPSACPNAAEIERLAH